MSSRKRFLTIFIGFCIILTFTHFLILLSHPELNQGFTLNSKPPPFSNLHLDHSYTNLNAANKDTLIDLQGFKFLKHNENLCQNHIYDNNSKSKLLLVLIHSSPLNLKYRNLIRKTWATIMAIGDWKIRYAFLMGQYSNASDLDLEIEDTELQNLLNETAQETVEQDDLIIGNFMDTYRNLSYKQIMGYKWALEFCPGANYVLKADNDVFIDVFQVVNIVDSLNSTNTIACSVYYNVPVMRGAYDKWQVSKEEYALDTFPNYCPGMGYLLSFDVIKELVKASGQVPYFWIDDTYVTGILREFVQARFGTVVNLVNIAEKFTFSDGEPYIKWLYERKCVKEEEDKLPWTFVHCFSEDVEAVFKHLWPIVLELHSWMR